MTHHVDCSIKEEFEDEVYNIAWEYWEGDPNRAEDRAEDLGWEMLGGGMGRTAWRVPTDVAEEHPCVVKFATGKGRFAGDRQNREEINQWRNFPERVRNAEPPVIAPVRDWGDDYLWLTMPEVQPGGAEHEVTQRLNELGWACEDLHHDNIGRTHGHSVVLDYGLECYETAVPLDLAQDIGGFLDHAVDIEDEADGATVYFETPEHIGGVDGPNTLSWFGISLGRGVTAAEYNFGPWDEDKRDAVQEGGEKFTDAMQDEWFDVIPYGPSLSTGPNGIEMSVEFELPGWDVAFTVEEFHEDAIAFAESFLPDAEDPREFLADVRIAMNDALDVVGESTGAAESTGGELLATWNFFPPSDNPGHAARQDQPSSVTVDGNGLREIHAGFGPWRSDEPQATRAITMTDKFVSSLQERWPMIEFAWVRWDVERDGREITEVYVTADPTEGEGTFDGADKIAQLYADMHQQAVKFLPAGRQTGDPVQEDIDVFASVGDAVLGAVCPTGDRCAAQAEAFAADMYDYREGTGDMDRQRINREIAEMVARNVTGEVGIDVSGTSLDVDGVGEWDFWPKVVASAAQAPDDRDAFIEMVSEDILGYAEEVIRAVE